jgi:hypothetical protein
MTPWPNDNGCLTTRELKQRTDARGRQVGLRLLAVRLFISYTEIKEKLRIITVENYQE